MLGARALTSVLRQFPLYNDAILRGLPAKQNLVNSAGAFCCNLNRVRAAATCGKVGHSISHSHCREREKISLFRIWKTKNLRCLNTAKSGAGVLYT